MLFNPPLIRNIEDVLPHIKDNPAFIVADKGWYKVIDYVYAHRDTFDNEYARECRGLKFDAATGAIIARPYHKFHNLGECAGYHPADVDLSVNHVVLDKLDGSMIHFALDADNKPWPMTRMGYTNVAELAHRFLIENCPYGNDVYNLVTSNPLKTFIFEYVGPYNRIVVPYREEQLILTGVRDIMTGEYSTYMGMQAYLAGFDIPLVGVYGDMGDASISDFMEKIVRTDEVNEGCIVRFDTGGMVKMKADIYCRKHKSKELTESFKGVVQLVVDGNLDDILSHVEEKTQEDLTVYQNSLLTRISEIHEGLRHILSSRKHMDQKTFALDIQENFPVTTQKLLFMTRKSGDGYAEIINIVKRRYNKEVELEQLFEDLGLPVWRI